MKLRSVHHTCALCVFLPKYESIVHMSREMFEQTDENKVRAEGRPPGPISDHEQR